MDGQRSKRAVKVPKKYQEDEDGDLQPAPSTEEVGDSLSVYRLLKRKEVTKDLLDHEVFVLWPDNGVWYRAELRKLRRDLTAVLEYPETEEDEEVDLNQLLLDGHIALRELRPLGHRLRKDEYPVPGDDEASDGDQNQAASASVDQDPPSHSDGEQQYINEEEDEMPDAGAIEEEPSEGSDASMTAPSEQGSSSSEDNPLVEEEEEALGMSGGIEEEDDEMNDNMDSRPSGLGKRRSTDAAQEGLAAKRARAGSLAEAARRSGWRPQTTPSSPPQYPSHPSAYPPGMAFAQGIQGPDSTGLSNRALINTDVGSSNGRSAVQSAEAAAARASQIAAAAMQAGAAAEEAVADAEDYETASKYAQELLGSLGKPKPAAAGKRFYGQTAGAPSRLAAAQKARMAAPNPQAVRDKVVANLAVSLEKAASELKKEGLTDGLPDATDVARAVEQALHKQYSVDKEYRQKVRSLSFNLRDDSNPELRARVLQGEVAPDRLVSMTPNELASKELSHWRQQKLQESLRNSVLDEEAAAKFSTAAALAAKESRKEMAKANYDKGLLAAVDEDKFREATPPVKDIPADLPAVRSSLRHLDSVDSASVIAPEVSSPVHPTSPSSTLKQASTERATKPEVKAEEEVFKQEGTQDSGAAVQNAAAPSTSAGSKAFNWASIKAQASKLAKDAEPADSRFKGFDEFMAAAKADAAAKAESAEPAEDEFSKQASQELPYLPSRNMSSDDEDTGLPDLTNLIGSSSSVASKQVWQGQMHVPGSFRVQVVADTLAGAGDVGRMFVQNEVEVKGRVNIDKLTAFLEDLRMSKNRTVSLGALMCASDASAADTKHVAELVQQYISKQRTGVLELGDSGLEAYIIPPCALVGRLLRTARKSAKSAARNTSTMTTSLEASQFLLAVIHRKDWKPRHPKQPASTAPDDSAAPAAVPATSPRAPRDTFPSSSALPAQHELSQGQAPDLASGPAPGTAFDVPSAPGHDTGLLPGSPPRTSEPEPLGLAPPPPPGMGQMEAQRQSATAPAGPLQQLQAALSAQSAQGTVLPAGLDLGSISALAAALGVQSVAMPGGQTGPESAPASSSSQHAPAFSEPAQLPHQQAHAGIINEQCQYPPQQQAGPPSAPQWAPKPGQPPAPVTLRPPEGYAPGYPPEYPPEGYQQPPHQLPTSGAPHGYGGPQPGPQPYAGEPRPGVPIPRPITLQTPGAYHPQQAPAYPTHPVRPPGPAVRPQGPHGRGYNQAPAAGPAVPAHRRQGLVGWEGLGTPGTRGGRRGGRDGSSRGRGPAGGRGEGRGRQHNGGRGGHFDDDGPQDFDRRSGSSADSRGRGGRQGTEGPLSSRGGRGAPGYGRGGDGRHDGRGRGDLPRGGRGRERGRSSGRGRWD